MEIQWPLILFTFFNCLASGIFLVQGILTLAGKGKAMQLASCVSAIVPRRAWPPSGAPCWP